MKSTTASQEAVVWILVFLTKVELHPKLQFISLNLVVESFVLDCFRELFFQAEWYQHNGDISGLVERPDLQFVIAGCTAPGSGKRWVAEC